MTETTTAPSTGTQMPTGKDDSELRYLLTAYLFDSLSEEGRLEVERQLENSETCREELEELRGTLSILTDALDPAGVSASSYSFEKKRMERVLEASRGKRPLRLLARPSMLSAAAAVLLFIGIAIPLLLSRIESTAPATGLSQSFEDSAAEVVAESSFAESRAQFAPRNLHKGEKSPESPPPQKPVILTPKTISSSQARRSAAPPCPSR